jgi:low density lipoprotein-related protein 2
VRTERRYCKAATRSNAKIYITNGNLLMIMNVDGSSIRAMRRENTMRRLTAFDYNNKTGRIYWADRATQAIYSASENGTNIIKIVSSGLGLVESIAIDWIGQNIYWTDYIMQHIQVAKLDGTRRKILFNVS